MMSCICQERKRTYICITPYSPLFQHVFSMYHIMSRLFFFFKREKTLLNIKITHTSRAINYIHTTPLSYSQQNVAHLYAMKCKYSTSKKCIGRKEKQKANKQKSKRCFTQYKSKRNRTPHKYKARRLEPLFSAVSYSKVITILLKFRSIKLYVPTNRLTVFQPEILHTDERTCNWKTRKITIEKNNLSVRHSMCKNYEILASFVRYE